MDEAWKRARLDELWDSYLLLPPGDAAGSNEPRALRAIGALMAVRNEHATAKAQRDLAGMIALTNKARMIWQLLSLEIGNWILDDGLDLLSSEHDDPTSLRFVLNMGLRIHLDAGPQPHRPAVDPVPVLLPRWVVTELRSALDALDQGEVHDIVKPVAAGRHGDAWTWDQMKIRALEHVAFLHGQNQTKKIVQQRVAAQMGIPATTLRNWEREEALKAGYEVAFQAGRLKVIFEDNPRYAEGDGKTVDSDALARLIKFRSEPSLAEFGQAYREQFGRRHNPD